MQPMIPQFIPSLLVKVERALVHMDRARLGISVAFRFQVFATYIFLIGYN